MSSHHCEHSVLPFCLEHVPDLLKWWVRVHGSPCSVIGVYTGSTWSAKVSGVATSSYSAARWRMSANMPAGKQQQCECRVAAASSWTRCACAWDWKDRDLKPCGPGARERRTVQLKVELNEVYYQQTTCLKAQATPAVASCAQHAGALSWNRGREGSSHRGPSAFLWPGSSASRGQQAASVRSPQRLHVAAASFLTLAAPRARDQRAHAQSLQRRSGSNP